MKQKALTRHEKLALVQIWLKLLAWACAVWITPANADPRVTQLSVELSQPGETMDAFILRIAPRLNKFTADLRAEVCGTIRTEQGRHAVVIRTYHDRYSCFVERDGLPYVHTHPSLLKDCWTFSLEDWKRRGYLVTEIGVRYQDTRRSRKVKPGR
ncbi:hypothetical protein LN461_14160 [Xanthomonas arboricola]|uniref:hypothetical protein n=1 Tax=Xanthomonas arboricola TaxID=56448 RepID=UPI001E62A1F7|nr:hypothetical protein [Xanthomonas arboricola]MCC8670478.1 hypothetical protein [Xanthomonas arboricola]